jgi:hypothetical protein
MIAMMMTMTMTMTMMAVQKMLMKEVSLSLDPHLAFE